MRAVSYYLSVINSFVQNALTFECPLLIIGAGPAPESALHELRELTLTDSFPLMKFVSSGALAHRL